MKLIYKLIFINLLIPMIMITLIIAVLQTRSRQSAEAEVKKALELQLGYAVSEIETLIALKKQYLMDQAGLSTTVLLYDDAKDTNDPSYWESLEEYRRWSLDFASTEKLQKDVDNTYVGYKGIAPTIEPQWEAMPDDYDTNVRPWYTMAVEKNGFVITPPYRYQNLNNTNIGLSMGYPIYRKGVNAGTGSARDIIGVAGIDVSLTQIKMTCRRLENDLSVVIGIYDRDGAILYDGDYQAMVSAGELEPPEREVMHFADFLTAVEGESSREANRELFDTLKGPPGSFMLDFAGEPVVLAHTTMLDERWIVSISQPFAVQGGPVLRDELWGNLSIGIILFIILAISTALIRLILIKNIVRSGEALSGIAEGDADLTVRMESRSKDEIGRMAESFNAFVGKMRNWVNQITGVISETDEVGAQLSSSTEETTASLEEASAIFRSIEEEGRTLGRSIAETVSAIEQINGNIGSIDSQIEDQASMVEESTAAITQMIASLGNVDGITKNKKEATRALSKISDEGKKQIDETSERFSELVKSVNSIQEMADVIDGIASQTNLLSMNAAIEAAHAGDAGKGFAVVAEEIRKLAETSSESSRNITALIQKVTEMVAGSDESVRHTSRIFDEIASEVGDTVDAFSEIEHSISELNAGSRQVLKASEEINELTVQIRSGSGEINNGTASILEASTQVQEISERMLEGMGEVSIGNSEILKAMQLMVGQTERLDKIVGRLKEQFGGFKTE